MVDATEQGMDDGADLDAHLNAITALVPHLLNALEVWAETGRRMHPPDVAALAAGVAPFRTPLAEALPVFEGLDWPEHLQGFAACVRSASASALRAFDILAAGARDPQPIMQGYRAMGHSTRAVEALYPVAAMLPPVSRFFLNRAQREDETLLARLAEADGQREHVGVMHAANTADERGGFSMYVPEYYDESTEWPLVVALHGGSGHGRSFLWSWLRDARTQGAIVLAPTSKDHTWSLMEPEIDGQALLAMVEHVQQHWRIDARRILLTGMSDGGTFSYVTGMRGDTPFTHLAPVSASFHPMLLEFAAEGRLQDLPVYLVHGALDWMFDIDMARTAHHALAGAGAKVEFREIADLSHTYPVEENQRMLQWLQSA